MNGLTSNKISFNSPPKALHKPRIKWDSLDQLWVCYDGGLSFYGDSACEAFNELSEWRNKTS